MNELAQRYGIVLYELGISEEEITALQQLFHENPELVKVLSSPVPSFRSKKKLIAEIMGRAGYTVLMQHFVMKLCEAQGISCFDSVTEAWKSYREQQEGVLEAVLYYVTEPDHQQRVGMEEFLKQKYEKSKVKLQMVCKPELLGGFVLKAGDTEFDYSLIGRAKRLRQVVTE